MRIVQLCCDPGVAYGGAKGAAVHLCEIARALAGAGAEVLVAVARSEPGAPAPPGVRVETLPGPARHDRVDDRIGVDLARSRWLQEQIIEWRADAIYERFALHTVAGIEAAREARVPHLLELNAPLVEEATRYRRLAAAAVATELERRVLAGSDLVLAVSRPLGAFARRRGASRVEVMPNAVDPTRFTRPADAAGEPPMAVFAGSLRRWHGVGTLAEAWSILGADAPRLVVVGDGDGRDRLASVGAQVTGWVAPDAVAPLMGRAQIGLAPYPAHAPCYFSPLKLFDYLAAGLAVVAADLPGVRDVADAALLVPPGDPAALADAVRALVADPELRRHLGADGRALALEHHTWDRRARRLVALVDELRTVAAR